MIVSVTVLGSSDGTPATEIARRIVEYLEGGRVEAAGRTPGRVVELPSPAGGTAAYYADAAGERPGRWALAPDGLVPGSEVDTKVLARVKALVHYVVPEGGLRSHLPGLQRGAGERAGQDVQLPAPGASGDLSRRQRVGPAGRDLRQAGVPDAC